MGEAEKVEGLRPPLAACPPMFGDKFAEGDQARLVGVELERKPG